MAKKAEDYQGEIKVLKAQLKVVDAENANLRRDLEQKLVANIDNLPENVEELSQMLVDYKKKYDIMARNNKNLHQEVAILQKDISNNKQDTQIMKEILEEGDQTIVIPYTMLMDMAKWIRDTSSDCSVKELTLHNLGRIINNNKLSYTRG